MKQTSNMCSYGIYDHDTGTRKAASEWAGLDSVPVMVVPMNDEDAIIAMVNSNLQREHIKPSKKSICL